MPKQHRDKTEKNGAYKREVQAVGEGWGRVGLGGQMGRLRQSNQGGKSGSAPPSQGPTCPAAAPTAPRCERMPRCRGAMQVPEVSTPWRHALGFVALEGLSVCAGAESHGPLPGQTSDILSGLEHPELESPTVPNSAWFSFILMVFFP